MAERVPYLTKCENTIRILRGWNIEQLQRCLRNYADQSVIVLLTEIELAERGLGT